MARHAGILFLEVQIIMKSHMRVRALCEGAVLVAVAQILSYLKLWEMPWGGSVVLSMIPLVLYAVRWGLGAGLRAASPSAFCSSCLTAASPLAGSPSSATTWWPSPSWVWPVWWRPPQERRVHRHSDRRLFPLPGALCGGRHRLGGIHARDLLRHDYAQPLVLLPAVQSGVHAPQHRYHPFWSLPWRTSP